MEFLKEFVAEETENFEHFDAFIGETILGGIVDAIAHFLSKKLRTEDSAELDLPFGTFRVAFKSKGDIENINVSFAESKDFVKCINGDIETLPIMTDMDDAFINYIINFVGTGVADPSKESDKINTDRVGVELARSEAEFFINEIAKKLAKLAKEFEKPGKLISFEIPKLGAFEFSYGDDKTTVRFITDLIFKQAMKDDTHSASIATGLSSFAVGGKRKKTKKTHSVKLQAK